MKNNKTDEFEEFEPILVCDGTSTLHPHWIHAKFNHMENGKYVDCVGRKWRYAITEHNNEHLYFQPFNERDLTSF